MFRIIVNLCIVAFLLAAPAAIAGGIHKSVYSLRAERAAGRFQGEIAIWHIVSFKTGAASGVSYLRARAASFEKSNPYVYMDVQGMTPQEAAQRMENGEQPDILSYPLGFLQNTDMLAELPPTERLLPAYAACGGTWAYPYMADTYTLLCNQELCSELEIPLPLGDEFTQANFAVALDTATKAGKTALAIDAETWEPYMALLYPQFAEDDGSVEPPEPAPFSAYAATEGTEAFLNGEAAMLLLTSGGAVKLAADKRMDAMSISQYPISEYTDAVQFVSVARTEDAAKEAMCAEFAAALLKRSPQSKLAGLQMLPTTNIADIYDGERTEDFLRAGEAARVPGVFAATGQDVSGQVRRALDGDGDALDFVENLLFR